MLVSCVWRDKEGRPIECTPVLYSHPLRSRKHVRDECAHIPQMMFTSVFDRMTVFPDSLRILNSVAYYEYILIRTAADIRAQILHHGRPSFQLRPRHDEII